MTNELNRGTPLRCAYPSNRAAQRGATTRLTVVGNRKFESSSLQRRVRKLSVPLGDDALVALFGRDALLGATDVAGRLCAVSDLLVPLLLLTISILVTPPFAKGRRCNREIGHRLVISTLGRRRHIAVGRGGLLSLSSEIRRATYEL